MDTKINKQLSRDYEEVIVNLTNAYLDSLVDIVDESSDRMLKDLDTIPNNYRTPKTYSEWHDYIQTVNKNNNKSMLSIPSALYKSLIEACRGYTLEDMQNKYLLCKLSLVDVNQPNLFMYFCNLHFADIITNLVDSKNINYEVMYLTSIEDSIFGTNNTNDSLYNSVKLMTEYISREQTDITMICTTYKASIDVNGKCIPDRLISIFDRPSVMICNQLPTGSVKSSFMWSYDSTESPNYLFDKYHCMLNQLTVISHNPISPMSPLVMRYSFSLYTKMLTTQTALSGLHEFCKSDDAGDMLLNILNAKTLEPISLASKSSNSVKFMFNYPHIDHRFVFDVSTINATQSPSPKTVSSYVLHRNLTSDAKMINTFAENCKYEYCPYTNTNTSSIFEINAVNKSNKDIEEVILRKLLNEIYFVLFDSFKQLVNETISLHDSYLSPLEFPRLLAVIFIGVFNELKTALLCCKSAQFDTSSAYIITSKVINEDIIKTMRNLVDVTITRNKQKKEAANTNKKSNKKSNKKKQSNTSSK